MSERVSSRRRLFPSVAALVLVGGVATACAAANREASDAAAAAATESPQRAQPSNAQGDQTGHIVPDADLAMGDVADTLSNLDRENFAGLTIDEDTDTIVTHWVHEVPARVDEYLAKVPNGIHVEVLVGASYTRDQLLNAAERITQSSLGMDTGVSAVAVNSDGSGVTVQFNGAIPGVDRQEGLAEIAGLPESALNLVPDSPVHPL